MQYKPSVFALLKTAEEAIYKAGSQLLQSYERIDREKIIQKKDGTFVTQIDKNIENFLIESILKRYDDHSFLTEEQGIIGKGPYQWIIDPIDGTHNFIRQIPIAAISMALYFHGKPLLGLVYQPFVDELFTAIDGHGSQLNGNRIRINHSKNQICSNLSLSLHTHSTIDMLASTEHFTSIRSFGATSIELAYVAAGKLDAHISHNVSLWDIAAGKLIIEEARGHVEVNINKHQPHKVESVKAYAKAEMKNLI